MIFTEIERDILRLPTGATKTYTDAPLVMRGIQLFLQQDSIKKQVEIIDIIKSDTPKACPVSITIKKR